MSRIDLIATSAFGIEAILKRELESLGYSNINVSDGRCGFQGNLNDLVRANLWLRTADRVLIKAGESHVETFDQLFEYTRSLPWEHWISSKAKFPVLCNSVRSKLHHVPTCQSIIKKAIVERLKKAHGVQILPESGSEYTVRTYLRKDDLILAIDSSGSGLFKRGYRTKGSQAPIKETLAAAMIQLTYWNEGRFLLDPFCGSGTLPIEAAMIALNRAPGMLRQFAFQDWPQVSDAVFKLEKERCKDLAIDAELSIQGSDIDEKVIKIARNNASRAGLGNKISFKQKGVRDIWIDKEFGILSCNPPYGMRITDMKEASAIIRQLGNMFRKKSGWSSYIVSPIKDFERLYGRKADRRRKLFNGKIEVCYYQYQGRKPDHI